MSYIIVSIIIVLLLTVVGLIAFAYHTWKYASTVDLHIQYLQDQINSINDKVIRDYRDFITTKDIVNKFKEFYNNGLISKEDYEDLVKKIVN